MPARNNARKLLGARDYVMALAGAALAMGAFMILTISNSSQTALPYSKEGVTAAWLPPTVMRWKQPVEEMSRKYDIDANLVAILMTMVSGGDPKAKSGSEAMGLLQLTPPTAKDTAAKFLKTPVQKYDLYDPRTSIEFGTAYLAYLRDQFGSARQGPDWLRTVELVAAGYNGGPGTAAALERGEGLRDTQTVVYSRDAFNMYRERVSAKSPTYDRWRERGGSAQLDAAARNQ